MTDPGKDLEEPEEELEEEPDDYTELEAAWHAEAGVRNAEALKRYEEAEADALAVHTAEDHHPSDRQHHAYGIPHHHSRLK